MRIFEHFNTASECMLCGTNEDKPCTLIGVDGTQDGNIEEAEQIHVDCLEIRYSPDVKMFYQRLGGIE